MNTAQIVHTACTSGQLIRSLTLCLSFHLHPRAATIEQQKPSFLTSGPVTGRSQKPVTDYTGTVGVTYLDSDIYSLRINPFIARALHISVYTSGGLKSTKC